MKRLSTLLLASIAGIAMMAAAHAETTLQQRLNELATAKCEMTNPVAKAACEQRKNTALIVSGQRIVNGEICMIHMAMININTCRDKGRAFDSLIEQTLFDAVPPTASR